MEVNGQKHKIFHKWCVLSINISESLSISLLNKSEAFLHRDDPSTELLSLYTSVWPTGLATNQTIQVSQLFI